MSVRYVEGGSHTKIWLGGHELTIPRHREINERLGRAILRDLDDIEKGA